MLAKQAYFNRFNSEDYAARASYCHSPTPKACEATYLSHLRHPSKKESLKLKHLTTQADQLSYALFPALVNNVPWKIMIANDAIESAFPHTIADTIILPSSHLHRTIESDLVDTLIHEKIHVYQRLYPCETNTLYTKYWNFKITGHQPTTPQGHRTNPDTNTLTYNDDSNTPITLAKYASTTTPRLDHTTGDRRDHPHEIMAYLITSLITSSEGIVKKSYKKQDDKLIAPTLTWLKSLRTN